MAEKKIEIRIAATGGDQAAAEVRKVEKAATAAAEATQGTRGFGGMMDNTVPRLEEAAEAMETVAEASVPMSEHLGEVAEGFEDASEAADHMHHNVRKIARVQQAQIISQLAGQVGMIGGKLREVADDLQEFDAEMANGMRNAGVAIEKVSGAVGTLAIGFAAGGPLGAALAGTVVMLGETASAWRDMEIAQGRAAQAAARAADLEQELASMLALGVDSYHAAADAADRLNGIRRESATAIDAEISSLERRNKIQNADDSAFRAQRDREDAADIRGGAAPEDIKIRRAKEDAAIELRRIDREEEIAKAGIREASNAVIKAEGELGVTQVSPRATTEQIEAAQKTVVELRARLTEMEARAQDAERINQARRREVRERTTGRIEGFQEDRQTRIQREEQLKAAQEKRAADRLAKQQEENTRRTQQSNEARDREAAGLGRAAVSLIPKSVTDKARAAVEAASAKLQDGVDGNEVADMLGLVERMATYIQRVDGKNSANAIKIAQLEARLRAL
jgi:hypothetical protein